MLSTCFWTNTFRRTSRQGISLNSFRSHQWFCHLCQVLSRVPHWISLYLLLRRTCNFFSQCYAGIWKKTLGFWKGEKENMALIGTRFFSLHRRLSCFPSIQSLLLVFRDSYSVHLSTWLSDAFPWLLPVPSYAVIRITLSYIENKHTFLRIILL